jgi:DNA processing protein
MFRQPTESTSLDSLVTISLLRLGSDTSAARAYKDLCAGRFSDAVPAERVAEVVGESGARLLRARALASEALGRAAALEIHPLGVTDPRYPERLRQIADPPVILWMLGAAEALHGPLVAVIGSRDPTTTGLMVAKRLSSELAGAGLTVVSGLARGIDGAAHRAAVDAGGRTVAVLGSGPDVVYPAEHRELFQAVRRAGAVVTEFPPGARPNPRHFPLRNRIISGLSQAVVVVEASEKSGTLITARAAIEQGRDVLAVPGSVLSGRYRGCHALIKDGARLVETVDDILEELGRPRRGESGPTTDGKALFPKSLAASFPAGDTVTVDELAGRTGRPAAEWLRELAILEVAGLIARVPGGGYVRVDGPATYIGGQTPPKRKDTGSRHAEGSRRRRVAREGEDD